MINKLITIIDYGMSNLGSVQNAFSYLGANTIISNNPAEVAKADVLLLPGVGSFQVAMLALETSGLGDAICEAVINKKRKILGICLGMQLLGVSSTEGGNTVGLGVIPASIDRIPKTKHKVPHIGFNAVKAGKNSKLMRDLQEYPDFYFVHSYRMLDEGLSGCVSYCDYGGPFVAAYEQDNIFMTQFHPEKSQTNGLTLLKNFLSI